MSDLQIAQCPSPNYGQRRDGLKPSLVVIHYTAMQSADAALARLCDPVSEVSAHYLISNTGHINQLVAEDQRAWHAGPGQWAGQHDINSRSIGIELDNRGDHPFSELQMSALEGLLQDIMTRWAIPATGVIGHSDMAPGRKCDPGPHFDWARLARQGLAAAGVRKPTRTQADEPAFIEVAHAAGFTSEVDLETLLSATRLRFAPWRTGPLMRADFSLSHLIAR